MNGAPGRIKRILVLCGVCYKESCPLSKWIEIQEDGGLLNDNWIDDYFSDLQSTLDKERGQVTSAITDQMPNAIIDENDIDRLLQGERKAIEPVESDEPIKRTSDEGFLANMLQANSLPADTQILINRQTH